MDIIIYVLICVGLWAVLMWSVEKFFRYLDSSELPEVSDEVCPTLIEDGEEKYGY